MMVYGKKLVMALLASVLLAAFSTGCGDEEPIVPEGTNIPTAMPSMPSEPAPVPAPPEASPNTPASPEPISTAPVAAGVKGSGFSDYGMIVLEDSAIEVSTINSPFEGKEALIDSVAVTHWHIKHPPGTDEHWIKMDMGAVQKVTGLAVMTVPGRPEQIWANDRAVLQGSNNAKSWSDIARLFIDKSQLDGEKPEWLGFTLPQTAEYRHYRLFIKDPTFLSIAEIQMYGLGGKAAIPVVAGKIGQGGDAGTIVPEAGNIEVSSFNSPLEEKGAMVDGMPLTHWHVKFPPESEQHWVSVDMESPQKVSGLAIMPIPGLSQQLWDKDHAVLQGSQDSAEWEAVARLFVNKDDFSGDDPQWVNFPLPDTVEYRYYRLLIEDPVFLSIAEFEMYGSGGKAATPTLLPSGKIDADAYVKIDLSADMVAVSSSNSPAENESALIDANIQSPWHVQYPPETDEHWFRIDMGAPARVEILSVIPTKARPEQFWNEDHALWQGSNDAAAWTDIARFSVDKGKLDGDDPQWLNFQIGGTAEYRYYRMVIKDSNFLSIGSIMLYEYSP